MNREQVTQTLHDATHALRTATDPKTLYPCAQDRDSEEATRWHDFYAALSAARAAGVSETVIEATAGEFFAD